VENWGSKKLSNEFPFKDWFRSGLDSLLRRIDATEKSLQRTSQVNKNVSQINITKLEELIFSLDNAPFVHKSPREIEQITGISRSSVVMLTDFLADHRPRIDS